jgi:hypothetical protein
MDRLPWPDWSLSAATSPLRFRTWLTRTTGTGSPFCTSTHRRGEEREYSIIFIWKIAQQLVIGYTMGFVDNLRRGSLAEVHQLSNQLPPAVRKAREASLPVKGINSSL